MLMNKKPITCWHMPHSFGFIDMVAFSEMTDSGYSHAELNDP
ncbi:hypothetical protein GP2143_13846 [marine gamma proteobacterium HTCC2143]|uniref:Uncharacterized protein n=1 Tax=marine gamma proteobacterium HTCC2143 TaxID=247633 RepID=A0Y889_9GAMM|nr:hypothetical protein GP2143_13846 [marine gamma proteobacterium HTCC2143]